MKKYMFLWVFGYLLGTVISIMPARAEFKPVAHPFILWTKEDAAAIKKQIETEPWARQRYEEMLKAGGFGSHVRNLFRYQIMDDKAAGETEKKYVLGFIGHKPEEGRQFSPNGGGRHYDNYLVALGYDVLYDTFTPEQRAQLEATFQNFINFEYNDKQPFERYTWLPNMQWPQPMAAHIMALAMQDKAQMEKLANDKCGWKHYMDDNVLDGQFYEEEFGKYYSMVGEMLIWCRGAERLGMDEIGFGYTGKGGANMLSYLESSYKILYPSIDLGSERPRFNQITMGDAKGGDIFQQSPIKGWLPNGNNDNSVAYWTGANQNGRDYLMALNANDPKSKIEKMNFPLWYELGAQKWPDAGFDYFLTKLRGPKDDKYYPSGFFGLGPVDPAKVKAPDAPSYTARERGFAMLHMDESPSYWTSPRPAVALQYGRYYVHYVHDGFALLGYVANNRQVYWNGGRTTTNYAGGDPWADSVRGHSGVTVDNKIPNMSEAEYQPSRLMSKPAVKFVDVRGNSLFVDVEKKFINQERALFLTDEYLFDVYSLLGTVPHTYHWSVLAPGEALPADKAAWIATKTLDTEFFPLKNQQEGPRGDNTWSLVSQQNYCGTDIKTSTLGQAWYDKKMGVRVTMLGEPGTRVFTGDIPNEPRPEFGGVSLIARRQGNCTTFVALHEPYKDGKVPTTEMRRIQQNEQGIAVAVTGTGTNDRLMLHSGADFALPITLAGDGESFTFTGGQAYMRISADKVDVSGDITALAVRVAGNPKLFINGVEVPATIAGGILSKK
ncbi:MAG: hypothetical protein WCJ56_01695 [bacterium]